MSKDVFIVTNKDKKKQTRQEQDQLTRKRGYKIQPDTELRAFVCSCGKRLEIYVPKHTTPICPKCKLQMVPEEGLG